MKYCLSSIGTLAIMLAGFACSYTPESVHAAEQLLGGIPVTVPTQDATGHAVQLNGMLWLPEGRPSPRAGLVFANGSSGWHDFREGYYGRMLAAAGYAALAIDSFSARGISDTSADQAQLSYIQMLRDMFAGRQVLIARGITADRLGIMGWSRGGTVVLAAADGNFLPQEKERFQVAIASYPGCNFHPRSPKPTSVLFVAIGEKDDYTGVKGCQSVVTDYSNAGGKASLKLYPNSVHAFDGDPSRTRMVWDNRAETALDCVGYVEEDGAVTYDGKRFDAESDFRNLMQFARRLPCMSRGASLWTNLTQKEAVTRDLMEFLNAAFAP